MTDENKIEIKPVQVSEREVRSWRRDLLISGTIGLASCLLIVGSATMLILKANNLYVSTVLGSFTLAIILLLVGKFITMLRDYKRTAWMKAFWEDEPWEDV